MAAAFFLYLILYSEEGRSSLKCKYSLNSFTQMNMADRKEWDAIKKISAIKENRVGSVANSKVRSA